MKSAIEWIRDVTIAWLLVIGGFVVAGLLAGGSTRLLGLIFLEPGLYIFFLILCMMPFELFLKRHGLLDSVERIMYVQLIAVAMYFATWFVCERLGMNLRPLGLASAFLPLAILIIAKLLGDGIYILRLRLYTRTLRRHEQSR